MSKTPTYRMTLSLNVLNHLGLKLYSNVPAVLSEVVANAWDADATNIDIELGPSRIVIEDDGEGLSRKEINERYLLVGYQRRDDRGDLTPSGRLVMGRKGIGKLSLFSIAEVVDVFTVKNGTKSALRLKLSEIKKIIEKGGGEAEYKPTPLATKSIDFDQGTRIVLSSLSKRVSSLTERGLRTRLARRFSIISEESDFAIDVNGEAVSFADRDYFHKLEYVWWYGAADETYEHLCSGVQAGRSESRAGALTVHAGEADEEEYEIEGWIGTARHPKDLIDEHENLNKIMILSRGKLAQEDVLGDFNDGRVFTKYLIGEIQADFLDSTDGEDIATSSRQRFIEDDPRYVALRTFLRTELNHVAEQWEAWRREEGTKQATRIPVIDKWYKTLKSTERRRAESLFGKINQLTTDSEDQRREMLQYGVMAFEALRQRDNLDAIESLEIPTLADIGRIIASHDDLEAVLYHRIVRERLAVIDTLRKKVERNDLEKVIQEHLYKHLWLLDPSWERATGTEYKEKTVEKAFKEAVDKLSKAEKKGRIDIGYQRTAGQHVIIELKRPDRKMSDTELQSQCLKYREALEKVLKARGELEPAIQIVVLVGKPLDQWATPGKRLESEQTLLTRGIRAKLYSELLESAYQQYQDFYEKKKEVGRLVELVDQIAGAKGMTSVSRKKRQGRKSVKKKTTPRRQAQSKTPRAKKKRSAGRRKAK